MKKRGLLFAAATLILTVFLMFTVIACDSETANGKFEKYSVKFYCDGELYATVDVTSADFDFLSALPEAPADKSGENGNFVFSHWAYEDGTVLTGDNAPRTGAELFAVFNEVKETFSVMFKDMFGNYIAVDGKYSQTVEKGGSAVAPEPPETEGYRFVCWDADFDNVTENLIVNAIYVANVHTLTFMSFGEVVAKESVGYGEAVGQYFPAMNVPDGFTFLGWKSSDGAVYESMPDNDLTYEAEWRLDVASDVNLTLDKTAVTYGESALFEVSFATEENIEYTVAWFVNGFERAKGKETSFVLCEGAGEYSVRAEVTAEYKGIRSSVLSETKTVVVEKAILTVSVVPDSVTYGEEYLPELSYSGFVGEEDESVLSRLPDVTTAYTAGADVGEYPVKVSGAQAENYEFSYVGATLTVVKKSVKVVADDASVVYGENFAPVAFSFIEEPLFDSIEEIGSLVLECDYPSKSVNVGNYVIRITGGFNGEKAKNYDFDYESGALTVTKKTVDVKVDAVENIVYLDPVPEFTYTVEGLEYGDGKESAGSVSLVCDYYAGASVGEYRVYAEVSEEGLNYSLNVNTTEENPVTFTVGKYTLLFEGSAIKDNRFGSGTWSGNASGFTTGLPAGYSAEGVLRALSDETGDYFLTGDGVDGAFEWEEPFRVLDPDGADRTSDFALVYDFKLSVGAAVNIEVKNYAFDYDGTGKGGGVILEEEGFTVSYLGEDGAFTEDYPVFVNAGNYTVTFRICDDEGATVIESTYKVTVNKVSNELVSDSVQPEYTYNGALQAVTGVYARYENAEISYVGNTFTDVPESGELLFTAIAAETANYKKTTAQFSVKVNKADYAASDVPSFVYEVETIPGKKLSEVAEPENFRWKNASAVEIAIGDQLVDAYYCADSRNYNEAETSLMVKGVKTSLEIISGDAKVLYNAQFVPEYYFEKNSIEYDASLTGVQLHVSASETDFAVGSTYKVTLSLDENEWYTAQDITVVVKVLSVLYENSYYTIEDALNLDQSNESYIIVAHDTSFATPEVAADVYKGSSYYTLSSGENLLVPYSEAHSTNAFDYATGTVVKNNAYVTLYIPSGITYESYGYTYVAAARNVGSAQPTGNTSGKYGVLNIADGAKFVSYGTFECLGFTVGDGLVEAMSGNIYEPMIAIGYKGGNITYVIRNTVFPISQYTLNNIIADMNVYSGVSYYAKAAVGASEKEIPSDVNFFGNTDSVFMNLQTGYMVKSYDGATGVVRFDVYGDIRFNNMSISLESPIGIGTVSVSTSGKQVPLPGYFDFEIKSGSTATVNAGVKLLPGASFTVDEGATLNVNKDVFVYSAFNGYVTLDKSDAYNGTAIFDGWQDGGNGMLYPGNSSSYKIQNYYYTDVEFDFDGTTPAVLTVKGTLNVASGGTLAGGVVLEGNGKIVVNGSANVSNTIKEDLCNYADRILFVNAHYFKSTASAYYINGGNEVALEKGKTYTATASGVTVS